MPLPLLSLLGIGAGMGIAQGITNNIGARKNQRQADRNNIKFWQMQNQYNDPVEQMTRLKKAGLNPNLIYGQSVSGATGQAGAVAPSKAAPFNIDAAGGAMAALQAHQTDAQVNNTNIDTAKKAFDLGIDKKYAAETIEQELTNVRLGNARKVIENNVAAGTMRDKIMLATENLAIAKSTLKGKNLQNAISEWQSEMKDMNIEGNTWVSTLLKFIFGSLKDTEYNNKNDNSKADRGKDNSTGYIIPPLKY